MSTILLTGATGMVGRELLARLAADPRHERVYCLVRPSAKQSAQARLDAVLGDSGGRPDPGRVIAIAGDVVQPELGLGRPDRAALAGVTRILHCAASVSFSLPLDESRLINVIGTERMLALARTLPRLERFDAVSTTYVAGRRDDLVHEAELEHARGFHNSYEQSKSEAEQLLRRAMSDLPIAVHRPSIVVGDSRTGKTGAWKVLYWPLKVIARGFLPAIPYDPQCRLDIVPVDFVADAILALADDLSTLAGTYHLAAGPGRDCTMADFIRVVFGKLGRRPPLQVQPRLWRRAVRPALMLAPSARLRRTLTTGLAYRPYLELRLRFDTAQADAKLRATSVACPAVLDYMDTIIDAALRSDFGRRS
ncbi:SDR family oxidoreductase [Nannocystaceae bacterium ST9]